MSFRESVSNFFRYLLLIVFVIAAFIGGKYFLNRAKAPSAEVPGQETTSETPDSSTSAAPPVATEPLPSQRLAPVMQTTLPALFSPIDGKPFDLGRDFSTVESEIRLGSRSEKMRPAWNTAGALAREIRSLAVERNAVTAALQKVPVIASTGAAPRSKAETADLEAKQQFFQSSARQRWETGTAQRKKKIEILYRHLLADESTAAR